MGDIPSSDDIAKICLYAALKNHCLMDECIEKDHRLINGILDFSLISHQVRCHFLQLGESASFWVTHTTQKYGPFFS